MTKRTKIWIPCDKREWHPSPLPGQVVLVTTVDGNGDPNVAPKSWISMAAFGPPPVLMFGCNLDHETARNVFVSGEFVVNIPGSDLMRTCWVVAADKASPRSDRFKHHGLTAIPSLRVRPPRIEECVAHIECALDQSHSWGREVAIFGTIQAVSMDEALRNGELDEHYRNLDPFFFLENEFAAPLGAPTNVSP
ncbi:MAG: flavin reductase family protein [Acidobacteriota bacterium]